MTKKKKPPAFTKCTKDEVAAAIRQHKGCLYLACRALKITHPTLAKYRLLWPELNEVIEEEKGALLDAAEVSMHAAILRGEAWAICFFLKTQGKHRGYIERQEHDHTGGVKLVLTREIVHARNSEGSQPPNPPASNSRTLP